MRRLASILLIVLFSAVGSQAATKNYSQFTAYSAPNAGDLYPMWSGASSDVVKATAANLLETISTQAKGINSSTTGLGANIITNGVFSVTGLTNWTISGDGTGWSIVGGKLAHAAGSNTNTISTNVTTAQGTYIWKVMVNAVTAGACAFSMTGDTNGDGVLNLVAGLNSFQWTITGAGGSTAISIVPSAASDITITSIAIYRVESQFGITTLAPTNFAVGTGCLISSPDSNAYHTAFGAGALANCATTSAECSAFGASALLCNTTGVYNNAFGVNALYRNTTGTENTACGGAALYLNRTGGGNTSVGNNSLFNNNADSNTAIGNESSEHNTTGSRLTSIGSSALNTNTTGVDAVAVGYKALYTSNGNSNVGVGKEAGYTISSGVNNTATGTQALYSSTTGNANAAFGYQALYSSTGGSNSAFGNQALYSSAAVNNNSAFGAGALYNDTSGWGNVGMGTDVLYTTSTSNFNTAMGYEALYYATGTANIGFGFRAGKEITAGDSTIVIGDDNASQKWMKGTQTGADHCIIIGSTSKTGINNSGGSTIANTIAIGGVATDSNQTVIGNASTTSFTAYGAANTIVGGTTGGLTIATAEAVSAALSGGSGSIAVNVPTGCRIRGVQLRVDTAITSGDGALTWTAAYVNTPTTAICSGQAFAKNTKFNAIHPAYEITTGTVTITITPDAHTFSGGVVRAIVYYDTLTAMGNAP